MKESKMGNIWQAIPRNVLGIAVYIATVYLNGTEVHSPWLGGLSVKFLEFKVSRLGFWAPILIQRYKNT